jgi:hypothetical protein
MLNSRRVMSKISLMLKLSLFRMTMMTISRVSTIRSYVLPNKIILLLPY